MKTLRDILIVVAVIFGLFDIWQKAPQRTKIECLEADTVVRVDTIRDTVPKPVYIEIVRYDSIYLHKVGDHRPMPAGSPCPNDTLEWVPPARMHFGPAVESAGALDRDCVILPIERKEYKTAEYSAIIEGFRPSLVSMEVYPRTMVITRRRFGMSARSPFVGSKCRQVTESR